MRKVRAPRGEPLGRRANAFASIEIAKPVEPDPPVQPAKVVWPSRRIVAAIRCRRCGNASYCDEDGVLRCVACGRPTA